MMKISVLVPVFNVEEYLVECIESVIGQTYNNLELILVDDGSTDESYAICNRYAMQYSHQIKVIRTSNLGSLHARVMAIEASSGDILVFLDADDCLREDALEKISVCFERELCDMVLFNTGECERFSTIQVKYHLENGQIFEGDSKENLFRGIVSGQIPNSVCLKAIRANCSNVPNHFCQYDLRHGEDLLLSAHFLTTCNRIVFIDEGLYYYRNRPGSAVHSFSFKRKESIRIVHTELEKYVNEWNLPDLKSIHQARKVKGWIYNLKLLMKNKACFPKSALKKELVSMATDPYFCDAFKSMEKSKLSYTERVLAWCLYKKQYFMITLFCKGKELASRVIAEK